MQISEQFYWVLEKKMAHREKKRSKIKTFFAALSTINET